MAELEEEFIFQNEGMDQDSDEKLTKGYFMLVNGINGSNGAINNIPANLLIGNPALPIGGKNVCVGSHEDFKTNSLVFFNYNSLGYHGIYRYYRNVPGFAVGEIQKLLRIDFPDEYTFDNPNPLDFSEDPVNLITGIAIVDEKLYWNAPNNKPSMLAMDRANITRKRLQYNLLFNRDGFSGSTTFTLTLYQSGSMFPIHTFTWISAGTTYAERVQDFLDAYYASVTTMAQFHIINHGDYVEIEMSKVGLFYFDASVTGTGSAPVVVPNNFYPDKDTSMPVYYPLFTQDLIDRVRYPSLCQPTVTYKTDPDKKSNMVRGRVFQFRTRYNYYDNSQSCLGAISVIPQNIQVGSVYVTSNLNYIEVDFTDDRLVNPSLVSIIKSVDILFREHTTGDWKIAETLQPFEFTGTGQQIYKFYNDSNYSSIDVALAVKPYDSVPLKAKSLEIVDDRLFDGGIEEGYDKPVIDASLDVTYASQSNPDLYTIKGIAFIHNVFRLYNGVIFNDRAQHYQYNQAIYSLSNDANDLVYGGIAGSYTTTPFPDDQYYVAGISSLFKSNIPLGGFTFYLAGTDFKGTSKQVEAYYSGGAVTKIDKPFYNCNTHTEREVLRTKLYPNASTDEPNYPCYNPFGLGVGAVDQNGYLIGRDPSQYATKVYQEYEIPNVPAGTYVLRMASHLLTDSRLNNGTRDYQRTSSNALSIAGSDDFEMVIVVGPSTADASNNVYIGASVVADLVKPELNGEKASVQCGYITDHDDANIDASSTFDELLSDTRIDNAIVTTPMSPAFDTGEDIYYVPFLNAYQWSLNKWYSDFSYGFRFTRCDHNGYYFYAIWSNHQITSIVAKTSNQTTTLSINKDSNNTPWAPLPVGDEGGILTAWRNTDDNITDDYRTKLEGLVSVSGVGQTGVAVINQWGAWAITDLNGNFSIITYDRKDFPATPDGTRAGNLIYSSSGLFYQFIFTPALDPFSLLIGPSDYNNVDVFTFADKAATISLIAQFVSALKRGWDGRVGLVYYNKADQKCAVTTLDALKLHILFYTEPDPATGQLANNYYPIITWEINHRPPDWAYKYQWVITENALAKRWLQWIANSIEYINDNDNGTTYPLPSSPGATMCKINLDNIGYYTINKHPNAVINFAYQKGDYLLPIRDAKNNFYTSYYEFEIIKVIGTDVYVYADVSIVFEEGMLFELRTKGSTSEFDVYHEFGECFEVKTAVIEGIRQKYHAGPLQDQTYGPAPTQTVTPARGVFTTGDAYYRNREMQTGAILATDLDPLQASIQGNVLRNIDDQSVSDFFASMDEGIGRANGEFGIVKSIRPSTVRFTNRYLPGSQVNGLSSNEPLNEKQFSLDFGLIQKLKVTNSDVLKAIFNNSVIVAMYINKGILREASGATLVAISEDVIPRTQEYERTLGTQNPESVTMNTQGDLFGWDERQGAYWRSSGNGLVVISDYYMHNYFQRKSRERVEAGYTTKNPAVYDLGHGKMIHTFSDEFTTVQRLPMAELCINDHDAPLNIVLKAYPSNTTLINGTGLSDPNGSTSELLKKLINLGSGTHGFTALINSDGCVEVFAPSASSAYSLGTLVLNMGTKNSVTAQFDAGLNILPNNIVKETIAFSIGEQMTPQNRWPEHYWFAPEYYGRIAQDVISFVNGQLWLHNQGPQYGVFYGVPVNMKIVLVGNKDFGKNKVYKGISYDSASLDWFSPLIETPITSDYPQGQKSKLSKSNFKATQATVWSAIKNDYTDPRFTDQLKALLNGRPMRGQTVKITLENDSRNPVTLFSVKIIYFYSELS